MRLRNLRCFQHVKWDPDAEELRKFAIAMVVGFAVIAGIVAFRHPGGHGWMIAMAVGIALGVGALIPGLGRGVYLLVNVPTSAIGFVVSHVLLTLIFYAVFTPLGLLLRLMGKDLLTMRRAGVRTMWVDHAQVTDRHRYYRQF